MKRIVGFFALGIFCFASQSFAADSWATLNQKVTELYQKKYYTKAIPIASRALSTAEKQFGPNSPETALSLNNLAMLYKKKKNYADAESLYKRSLAISEKIVGKESPDLAVPLNNLALLYAEMGKWESSDRYSQRALAILEKTYGKDHPTTVQARQRYADMKTFYKRK